jgi:hypothetical protein
MLRLKAPLGSDTRIRESAGRARVVATEDLGSDSVDLPALYIAADEASTDGQRAYLGLRGAQLVCLVVAALAGAVTLRVERIDLAGVVVGLSFIAALGLQYRLGSESPEKAWYDGRAAAESVKDLAWRYAMRAEPFLLDSNVDAVFVGRLSDALRDVGDLALPAGGPDQITGWMRRIRTSDLDARRRTYVRDRLSDQWDWYVARAARSRTMKTRWRLLVSVLAMAGAVGGFAKAVGVVEVDLLGLVATCVGASTAWLQTRQHETLAVAYGLTAQELASVRSTAGSPTDDSAWSTFVNDAEQAISREHMLWRASRTGRRKSH